MDFTFLNWFVGLVLVVLLLAILVQLPAIIWLVIAVLILIGIKNAK